MSKDEKQPGPADELDDLLRDLFDPGLDADQRRRLHRLLKVDPAARRRYIRYVSLSAMLEADLQWRGEKLVDLLGEPRGAKPAARVRAGPRARWRPAWFAAAASVLLTVGLVTYLWRGRMPGRTPGTAVDTGGPAPALATLTAVSGARWGGAGGGANPGAAAGPGPAVGSALVAGQPLDLTAGCAEVTFAGGARVVLEGPARFTATSAAALSLSAGKLVAVVPGGGFAVTTPTAAVTDLGTEFAVAVNGDRTTDVEVFEGKVQAQSPSSGTSRPAPLTLTQGQAATVSPGAVVIDPGGAVPQRFVRAVRAAVTSLDVVDLVAGGDGTTRRRGTGIDAATGASGAIAPPADFRGDGKYHRVPGLPVVDGCFVPDGTRGPVRVDSAGDAFAFPATSGESFGVVWAGGPVPRPPALVTPKLSGYRPVSSVLGGVDYGQGAHGLLHVHSNSGLTLDLAAVRRLHPGRTLSRFRCTAGNSFVNLPPDKGRQVHPRADAYVLVDGRARFARSRFTPDDGPFTIDVPLHAADRFLTVATTDGGDGIGGDWVLYADPVLDLGQTPSAAP